MTSAPVTALFGAGYTVGVSMALGWLLLGLLRVRLYRMEAALFAFISGAACLSLIVFLLALAHQARPVMFLVVGVAAIGVALWRSRKQPRRPKLPELPAVWRLLFGVVFVAFFACYFIYALAPEVSPDGSGYHLGNVARYARHAGFDWDFHSIYASLSQGMEMLFLVAFIFGRHSAAALVEVAFQAALPLLMVCYGRRNGFPGAAAFAAILVYASPVVGITGASAYTDVSVATTLFAVFFLFQVWDEDRQVILLFLCGLLIGFSYGMKYTAVVALPYALVFLWWRGAGKRMLELVAGTAILFTPWVLRDWIWLGNPVAPFLNRWFPNPYWTPAMENNYLAGLAHYQNIQSYFRIPVQLTVTGDLVPGLLGPVFLLAPLALLALRSSQGRRLLAAGAIFGLPALMNTEVRFLIPALPYLALAMGLAMANSPGVLPAVALFHAMISWPSVLTGYCDPNAWRIRGLPVRAALRLEPESTYIGAHIGDYALKAAIEQNVPVGERIFSFAGRPSAYLDRDIVVGYESTFGEQIAQLLERRDTGGVKALGIRFLLINSTDSVAAEIERDPKSWGISEIAEANGTTFYRID